MTTNVLSGITMIGACVLGGCSDVVWTQDAIVKIAVSSDFKNCLVAAVSEVPGVSINETLSRFDTPESVVITVPLHFESLGVYIQRRASDAVKVMFVGKGRKESDEDRAKITPLLAALSASIERHCR